jgi:hypothetical protein
MGADLFVNRKNIKELLTKARTRIDDVIMALDQQDSQYLHNVF